MMHSQVNRWTGEFHALSFQAKREHFLSLNIGGEILFGAQLVLEWQLLDLFRKL